MDNLSSQISAMLNDPETMEKIKGLSSMLSGTGSVQEISQATPAPPAQSTDTLPTETVNMVMRLAPILQSVNNDDDSVRLLKALRPFLGANKQAKLDEAIKMLGIMRLLPALKGMRFL